MVAVVPLGSVRPRAERCSWEAHHTSRACVDDIRNYPREWAAFGLGPMFGAGVP